MDGIIKCPSVHPFPLETKEEITSVLKCSIESPGQ